MASQSSSGGAGGVWQHANPFDGEQTNSNQAESNVVEEQEDDRLTGVRSVNPFADDQVKQSTSEGDERLGSDSFANDENTLAEDTPQSPISPTDVSRGAANTQQLDRIASGGTEESAHSPGELRNEGPPVLENTQGIDHAVIATSNEPTNTDAPDTTLDTVNSHVNGDRAERGTDVFANANPPHRDEDSGKESESDSDSGHKDVKKGITFAEKDDIEHEPTKEDDSNDGGFLDKVKTTLSNVKDKIHIHEVSEKGPLKHMNPTSVRMRVRFDDDPEKDVGVIWRSRDNRKNRNSVVIPRTSMAYPNLPTKNRPVYTTSFKGIRRNLWRMCFTFPYWDMAFWSGWAYTWGSVLFVIDGVWAWIPVGWPDTYLNPGIANYAIGVFFFVGAMLYQLGATIAYLEAVNDGSFHGSAMKRFLEGHEDDKKRMLDEKIKHTFAHLNPLHEKREHDREKAEHEEQSKIDPELGWRSVPKRGLRKGSAYPQVANRVPRRGGVDLGEPEEGETHEYLEWRWWPTWHAWRYHHIYEIGYVACSIQLFGATLYSWCGLDSIHGISDNMTTNQYYGFYWTPEIVGSCCFLSASVMFLLETQEKWYKPEPKVMGWWIGFWAHVGSWGFLLNGVFGVTASILGDEKGHWAEFQSECSTTWGSFGYLCSALCQWYEAVNKHPIEEGYYTDDGDLKSFQVHDPDPVDMAEI